MSRHSSKQIFHHTKLVPTLKVHMFTKIKLVMNEAWMKQLWWEENNEKKKKSFLFVFPSSCSWGMHCPSDNCNFEEEEKYLSVSISIISQDSKYFFLYIHINWNWREDKQIHKLGVGVILSYVYFFSSICFRGGSQQHFVILLQGPG